MQLEFHKLVIENFMSWKYQEIDLPQLGTILIQGITLDEDGHESNGSGKSSMWDALTWCFYGKSLRQSGGVFAKGNKLIRRAIGKNCRVDVYFSANGASYILRRAQKHADFKGLSLYRGKVSKRTDISGPSIRTTQKQVEDLLGMSHDVWTQSIFFGEGVSTKFTNSTPAQRIKIIESLVGLTDLDELSRLARKTLRQHEIETARTATERDLLRREKTLMYEEFKRHQQDALSFEQDRNKEMRGLEKSASKANGTLKLIHDELETMSSANDSRKKSKKIRDRIEENKERQKLISDASQSVRLKISKRRNDIQSLKRDASRLAAKMSHFSALEEEICPTCEQRVHETHVDSCIKELSRQHRKVTRRLVAAQLMSDVLTTKAIEHGENSGRIDQILRRLHLKVDELHEEGIHAVDLERQYTHAQDRIRDYERQISVIAERKNTSKTRMKATYKRAKKLSSQLRRVTQRHKEHEDDRQYIAFWAEALGTTAVGQRKPLRTFVIESIVPFLNDEVRKYTTALTQKELVIKFSTKVELASGRIKEQFNVDVSKRRGADSYELSSAGERRRADICIAAALQSLVATRRKCQTNFRIYDELFDGLDPSGIERVVDMLGRFPGPTFVITHRSGLGDHFNHTWTVQKEKGVSKLNV